VRSEYGVIDAEFSPALSAWSAVRSFTVPRTPVHVRGLALDAVSDVPTTVTITATLPVVLTATWGTSTATLPVTVRA
jgi:hypothetical protein